MSIKKLLLILLVSITTFYHGATLAMKISSPAFKNNGYIPTKYTCEGENTSPALIFEDIPANAKTLVMILDDPDATTGIWTHWVLYNIPAQTKGLDENVQVLPAGTLVGKNSWRKQNYGGPCPPSGTHRYFFKLFALDVELDSAILTSPELQAEIEDHTIIKTEMIGLYKKIKP